MAYYTTMARGEPLGRVVAYQLGVVNRRLSEWRAGASHGSPGQEPSAQAAGCPITHACSQRPAGTSRTLALP